MFFGKLNSRAIVGLAMALGCILSGCDKPSPALHSQAGSGPEEFIASMIPWGTYTETDEVKIVAAGHLFKIPRNYLQRAGLQNEKIFFEIVIFFPGFEGANRQFIDKFKSKNAFKYTSRIQVNRLTDSFPEALAEEAADEALADKDSHGLIVTRSEAVSDSYIFIEENTKNTLRITCDKNVDALSLCIAHFDYLPGIKLRYQYHASLFPEWKTIHSKIIALMGQFKRD